MHESVALEQAAEERRAAVQSAEALRRTNLGDPADLALVADELESSDPLISGTAISTLMQAPADTLLQELASRPERDGPTPVPERILVSWLLAHRSDVEDWEGVWPVCQWSETTEPPGARSLAAAACAQRRARAGGSLDELMDDPHWTVRCRVVTALARDAKRLPRVREWIARRGAEDPHPTVRNAARQALEGPSGTAHGQIDDRA